MGLERDVDLTDLMTDDEIVMLESNRLDPNDYAVVALMGDFRVSEPDLHGGRVTVSHGYLPTQIMVDGAGLLGPGGEVPNPFDGAIALPPSLRLIVRRDRLAPQYLDGLEAVVNARNALPLPTDDTPHPGADDARPRQP